MEGIEERQAELKGITQQQQEGDVRLKQVKSQGLR